MEIVKIVPIMSAVAIFIVCGSVICIYKKNNKKLTVEQFKEQVSKKLDLYMHKEKQTTGILYMGKCEISIKDVCIVADNKLYGKDPEGKWHETNIVYKEKLEKFSSDTHTKSELEKIKKEPLVCDIVNDDAKLN